MGIIGTKIQPIDVLTKSRDIFLNYANECNHVYRTGHELEYYKKIIGFHKENNEVSLLVNNEEFCKLVYKTLKKWNMDQRRAKLTTFDSFSQSIKSCDNLFKKLYEYKLITIEQCQCADVLMLLKQAFENLNVMQSKRRIVGISKTLHFFFPDLVTPVDGKYTMHCFYGYNKNSTEPSEEFEIFKDIFLRTCKLSRKLNLTENDVNNIGWHTSIPKLIDNAIIGFIKKIEKSTIKSIITSLENLAGLDLEEKKDFIAVLSGLKAKLERPFRNEVRKKLLLKKAVEAGIEVSDEEIKDELKKLTESEIHKHRFA